MEFDPDFHGQFQFQSQYHPTFFPKNPTSPQQNNSLVQPNNTTFVTNMADHSKSSSAFIPVSPSPPELMTEGVVLPPCLGQHCFLHHAIPSNEQFIQDFIEPANLNFAPQNSNHNIASAKFILDFTENKAVIPTQFTASSSHPPTPPPPPPVSDGGSGSMLKLEINENLGRQIKKRAAKTQNDGKSSKGQWTPEDDRVLKELVEKHGVKKWAKIAKLLDNRIGKQCRERWYNHLLPNIKKGPWTLEEDIMLIKAHKEVGNKWAKIAKRIPGRSENTIKNRWNTTKRSKNIKAHNNTTGDEYDDSVLRAYIKDVTAAATTAQKDKKKATTSKNKKKKKKNEGPISKGKGKGKAPMFSGLCNTDLGLTLRMEFPTTPDFGKEESVVPLFRNAPMQQDNGN